MESTQQAAWMNDTPAVIVNIQRQPGANTISVVDRIHRLLPQLQATLPAGLRVTPLTDLTTSIKASIHDVEFELMLTVVLVVLVIFVFLRSLWATIIPSIAVPVSIVGTFAAMYGLGYSLDNLSLMALTISTGFVVDDAIVMIENVSRYLEAGKKPLEAALEGAAQIGFTIVSLTVSLIAVLVPLLFMSDVVGRLFREFAVTLAVTIVVSACVSLTLTPMMCARVLRHREPGHRSRVYRWSEQMFARMIAFYGRTLKVVLRHQPLTLVVALATLLLTIALYVFIPKGFFPVQDTGVIQGVSQAPQSISFAAMADRQRALARVILRDPAVESLSSFIGVDGTNTTINSGRFAINLKPLAARGLGAADVIRRLTPVLAREVPGITLFMQPVQNITVDDRASRTQYQYTLRGSGSRRGSRPGPPGASSSASNSCRSSPTWPPISNSTGPPHSSRSDRVTASRLWKHHHPRGHRQHPLRRVRPASDQHDVHAVEPIPRDPRGGADVSRPGRGSSRTSTCRPARRSVRLARRR